MSRQPWFSAAIFDFDDTLALTMPNRWHCLVLAAQHFGTSLDPDAIREYWGLPFGQLIERLMPAVPYEDFYRHYFDVMALNPSELAPGAEPVLRELKSLGIVCMVVSSGSRELVSHDLEVLGIAGYLEKLYAFEDCEYHKPDPRVFDGVRFKLMNLGIAWENAVCLGDSTRDLIAAEGAGLQFVAITTGLHSRLEFRAAGLPDARIFDSLDDWRW